MPRNCGHIKEVGFGDVNILIGVEQRFEALLERVAFVESGHYLKGGTTVIINFNTTKDMMGTCVYFNGCFTENHT